MNPYNIHPDCQGLAVAGPQRLSRPPAPPEDATRDATQPASRRETPTGCSKKPELRKIIHEATVTSGVAVPEALPVNSDLPATARSATKLRSPATQPTLPLGVLPHLLEGFRRLSAKGIRSPLHCTRHFFSPGGDRTVLKLAVATSEITCNRASAPHIACISHAVLVTFHTMI